MGANIAPTITTNPSHSPAVEGFSENPHYKTFKVLSMKQWLFR